MPGTVRDTARTARVWGGEFLLSDETGFERLAHLYQYPMPGADICIYRLYRMAMGVLSELYDDEEEALLHLKELLEDRQEGRHVAGLPAEEQVQYAADVERRAECSTWRLRSSGLRTEAQYDGQAACELEAVAVETGIITVSCLTGPKSHGLSIHASCSARCSRMFKSVLTRV